MTEWMLSALRIASLGDMLKYHNKVMLEEQMAKTRKAPPVRIDGRGFLVSFLLQLLTQAESLDDGAVALNITLVKVIEQGAALSYELCQGTCRSIIFTVLLNMFRQMSNTVGEQCYLALR